MADIAVLDIGSKSITVLIGEKNDSDIYYVKGLGQCPYAGYSNGEFFEPENLKSSIITAMSIAQNQAGVQIKKFFVGVPGEFTQVVCREVKNTFLKAHKISEKDVEYLYSLGNKFDDYPGYTPINCSQIYFILNGSERLINPVGMVCNEIKGLISYALCDDMFLNTINIILDELGIKKREFSSSCWAEAMHLFQPIRRDKFALLADIGYISTSVMLIRGDGLMDMISFSFGGGNIIAELMERFEIDFDIAAKLKSLCNLSLQPSENEVYSVEYQGERYDFLVEEVNEIVAEVIGSLGVCINEAMAAFKYECPRYIVMNLTGGGISNIRGAKDELSKVVRRPVEIIASNIPMYNKPSLSTTMGMLDISGRSIEKENIITKLLKFI